MAQWTDKQIQRFLRGLETSNDTGGHGTAAPPVAGRQRKKGRLSAPHGYVLSEQSERVEVRGRAATRKVSLVDMAPLRKKTRVEIVVEPETSPRKIAARRRHALSLEKIDKPPSPKRKQKSPVPRARPALPIVEKKRRADPKSSARDGRRLTAVAAPQRVGVEDSNSDANKRFAELRDQWLRNTAYLLKFAGENPSAPDIVAAIERNEAIQAEWERWLVSAPQNASFKWPSSDAPDGENDLRTHDWEEVGMLGYIGYRVGRASGLTPAQRRQLLSMIFRAHLPPLNSFAYMREWGAPGTGARLRKMAESIAAFARNRKRGCEAKFDVAVGDWETDLHFLKSEYYVDRFDFSWPK